MGGQIIQAKGQVTIPKEVRDEMGLKPGDAVVWVKNAERRWELWTFKGLADALIEDREDFLAFLEESRRPFRPGQGP